MAQNFSNLLPTNPASSALNGKINPPALKFPVGNNNTQTTTPMVANKGTLSGYGNPAPLPQTFPAKAPAPTAGVTSPYTPPTGNITSVGQASTAGAYDATHGSGAYNATGGNPVSQVTPTASPATIPQATQPQYANPLIQQALDAQNRAKQVQDQSIQFNTALNQGLNNITKQGIALPFVQGQQGALQRDYGVQATQLANQASAANQQTQNATQIAGLGQPQQYSLTSQPYFPATDTYGGGSTGGAINRSIQASNIGTAGDFQSKIQQTQATKSSADADIGILQSYAQGIGANTPIVSGLTQLLGNTAQGNSAVSGFQSKLQTVRSEYAQLNPGADPTSAIPDNITPNQLAVVQQSIASGAQNTVAGLQKQLTDLQSGGSAGTGGSDYQSYLQAIGQ